MTIRGAIRHEASALWGDGAGRSLVVIAGAWGLLLGTRMIYPVLLPYFQSTYGLSLSVAGLLVTVLWLGSALGQLPGGVIADRYDERTVMTAGLLVVAVAVAGVVLAPTAIALFAATALIGIGQSLYPIARITALADLYPDRIGSALGVTMATGDFGQMALPPIAGALAAAYVWQAGFGFMIPLLLIAALLLWVLLPPTANADSAVDEFSVDTLHYVLTELRRENMLFIAVVLFLYLFVWQAFTGFYPTYLIEVKGLPSSTAALLFSLFFAVGVLVKPLSGAIYDRIGIRGSLVIVLSGPVVGLALLPTAEGLLPLIGITALVSTMLGSGAITQSYLSDSLSADMRGTGLGVIRTTTATLGATGPVAFGLLAEFGYFNEGYLALAVVMLVVIGITLRLPSQ